MLYFLIHPTLQNDRRAGDLDVIFCAQLQNEYCDVMPNVRRVEFESFLDERLKHGAIALDPPLAG